ncbi:AP-3 complex subunit delta isoform X3 [Hermetia illucens]|nr:AP-3 complex subunit delta isoform X3 [Hermetia illucens]
MALKKVKGNFERMFDKNLTDLVRGIRNNKDNEAKYIAQCIEEIKQELRQDNINVKCNAVAKLTYIQMLGYDISWAGFNIIEVMSSSKFTCKRVGYLAASQCFHPDSELLMLTTNMIRKDLNSQNQYDAGVALSGLSCFISADLSRDLANDIMTLMSSTKPYLRMKAVLMMYKVFLRYPEALRPAFPKLKEKLEDPDPGVQSAAVNVICELARKNPKNYLSLAPIFFKLMTTSTNNWMLIKIIKLFGALTPLEPRLGKKLIEPLTNLIHSTSAMSLLYECINTVIAVLISISSGMPNHSASIQLCVQKLRILIEDSDQNLKYLGLLAMSKILKTHPKSVQAHKDLILACLDDKDESIRLRALDLLYGMVSKKNLMEIVKRLLGHMERAEGSAYRDELLYKVIEICSQGSYQYVTNFEWYLTVLVELIQLEAGSKHGGVIATQLLDVSIRVQAIRPFAVSEMTNLLDTFPVSNQSDSMYEVLYAAAWIVGEFASEIDNPENTLSILLRPRPLPGHIKGVFVQNIMKLFTRLVTTCLEKRDVNGIIKYCDQVLSQLSTFISSSDIEVQERANSAYVLIELLRSQFSANGEANHTNDIISDIPIVQEESSIPIMAIEIVQEMALLFVGDLNPVAPKAQRKVQVPDGLNLDEWINTPPDDSSSSSEEEQNDLFISNENHDSDNNRRRNDDLSKEEIARRREARMIEQSNNPHYLKSNVRRKSDELTLNDGCEDIPIAELALEVPLQIHSKKRSDQYLIEQQKSAKKKAKKTKKSKKSKHKVNYSSSESEEEDVKPLHVVNTTAEMPEGAKFSDSDDKETAYDPDDPHRALDIDLEGASNETYQPPSKASQRQDVNLLHTLSQKQIDSNPTASTKQEHKKKSKSKDNHHTSSSTSKKDKKDKERKERKKKTSEGNNNETDLLGTPIKSSTKEKRKKDSTSSSHKIKDKDRKEKKSKHSKKESKSGYEEACGISTPSKEVF